MKNWCALVVIVVVICGLFYNNGCNGKQVVSLPGYNGPKLSMFTGYITVDQSLGKNIFYWLVESQNKPATDPLIIWFQGGPGCSGLFGLFIEHGPLRPNGQGGLMYTDISYTNIANVVYIESPACVGFSYANSLADCTTNDNITAQENLIFVKQFLKQYPQYVGRDLWFAGESYGGVYVPTLTYLALQDPVVAPSLRGIMTGNPVFNCDTVRNDLTTISMNTLYWHGLVSYHVYLPFVQAGCLQNGGGTSTCMNLYNEAVNQIGQIFQQVAPQPFPSLDPDNLYQDFCTGNGTLRASENLPGQCNPIGDQLTTYLNRKDVQAAIGSISTTWDSCASDFTYNMLNMSMVPYYNAFFFMKPGFNVLVYSGDVDVMTVPFSYTQPCVNELDGIPIAGAGWQPWFVNGATAGYVEVFDTYTYATLRGAGHESPQYQPLNAFNMFQRFLTVQNLTDGRHEKLNWQPSRASLTQGQILKMYSEFYG